MIQPLPGLLAVDVLVLAGVALSLALIDVRRARGNLERHVGIALSGGRPTPHSGGSNGPEVLVSGWFSILGKRLRGVFAVGMARTWGMRAGVITLLSLTGGASCVSWLLIYAGLHLSGWIGVGFAAGAGFLAPRMLLKYQQSAADQQFVEAFPGAIDMVIRMLRAGLPVTTAIRGVGNEALPPVKEVFSNVADQMAIGGTFEHALATAADRVNLPDFQFFGDAISLQRMTGGNLIATLDILSEVMRKRRAVRLKARATTGEVRLSAYVLGAIPFLILGELLVVSPDYLEPLLIDPRGNGIITVALVSLLTGFAAMRQIMRSVTQT